MFSNLIKNWYTDLVTVWRTESYKEGNTTKQRRVLVKENIPCRVYRNSNPSVTMKDTASQVTRADMMAVGVNEDIKTGDELLVIRGGNIGKASEPRRYFAGEPVDYYEPFGGAVPDLQHKQIALSGESRTK